MDIENFQFITREALTKESSPHKTCIRPSMAGKCLRMQYYAITGEEEVTWCIDSPIEKQVVYGFKSSIATGYGNYAHDTLQDAWYKSKKIKVVKPKDIPTFGTDGHEIYYDKSRHKIEISFDVTAYTSTLISGSCDGVLEIEGEKYIVDIKTMQSKYFKKKEEVIDKYTPQFILYSICLGINKFIVYVIQKDTAEDYVEVIEITPDMRFDLMERLIKLDECLTHGIPAPKEPDYTACKFCPFMWKCGGRYGRG